MEDSNFFKKDNRPKNTPENRLYNIPETGPRDNWPDNRLYDCSDNSSGNTPENKPYDTPETGQQNNRPDNPLGITNKNFNVIIADTDWETFEALSGIRENYNFLNLSSEFAVNFILDYEKIDVIIISLKIGGLEAIEKKAERKKTKVYLLGKDLKCPVDREEVLRTLKKEYDEKIIQRQPGQGGQIMASFKKLFKFMPTESTRPDKPAGNRQTNKKIVDKRIAFNKPADKNTSNSGPVNIKHGKKQDKKSQFYNDFWKEVATEADENCLDSEEVKKPGQNMHEYGKNEYRKDKEWTPKLEQTLEGKVENNEFPGFDLQDNKKYAADKNFENNGSKIKGFDHISVDNSFKQGQETNNPDINSSETDNPKITNPYTKNPHTNNSDATNSYITNPDTNDAYTNNLDSDSQYADDLYTINSKINNPHTNDSYFNDPYGAAFEKNSRLEEKENLMQMTGKVITIKQKIMVFVKAKGGVGSTFLSLYLAHEFRKLKTLLIDLNFSEGGSDIGYYLGMPKSPNMMLFTEGYNRASMDNSVISFKGHFDILQSPPSYDLTKKLDMQDIYSIVDVAKKKYHLLIFDLPNQVDDIFFGVLDMADIAILVSDYTPGSIGRLASINKRFIYNDMEKILVLNKNKNNNSHSFIKNNISEFFSLKEIVNIDENSMLSGKSDFWGCDFSNFKEMLGFKKKVMECLTCD